MMDKNFLAKIKKVHFVGIGGIGISAIARMMLLDGREVSGSDRGFSVVTDELKKMGAKIRKGHNAKNVQHLVLHRPDLVVYTTAVSKDNPELKKARKLKIPVLSYPEILGLISKGKYTIAVSGTHGKTTTTAMLGKILTDAESRPTIIVGSLLKKQKSNFVAGKGRYFVCEACEYKKAFLNLEPKIIIITNIDNDHLDYYKNLNNIQKAFAEFATKLSEGDFLICDKKSPNLKIIIKKAKCKIIDYSEAKLPKNFRLKIPGEHNIKNAKAALAAAKILGVSGSTALRTLKNFNGTWRRFEYKGRMKNGALVYDDYAHHPTEIKATLKAARENFKNKKIFCVFQPHLYSRTRFLLNDFAKSFNDVDAVIIADIYAAREKKDKKIHAKDLAGKIKKYRTGVFYMESFKKIEKFLRNNAKREDVIFTIGAGDVFKIGEKMLK